jgi:predicted RNA-binding Zn ribbon-like protein
MPAPFQLIAAHPVLDFVNTLDNRFIDAGPTELLCGYADLLRFTQQTGLLDPKRAGTLAIRKKSAAAARSLAAALDLREAMAAFLYGILTSARPPSVEVMKVLERKFLEADAHQELVWNSRHSGQVGTSPVDWQWGRFDRNPELPVWALAQSAARLVTSSAMKRVHMCHSETCRWLFLDTSKNHTRRWCDMKICGNRMKARSFHARYRQLR